jgi:hypothetical protein
MLVESHSRKIKKGEKVRMLPFLNDRQISLITQNWRQRFLKDAGPGPLHRKSLMNLWLLVLMLSISVLPLRASILFAAFLTDRASSVWPETRQVREETDPTNEQACYSMGQISITYESGEFDRPNVGLRITDPRGREIGYDVRTNRGWQELPIAQAFFDCDENEDTGELRNCVGHIQICGPISGTYQMAVLPRRSGRFSITVWSMSEAIRNQLGFHTTSSNLELKSDILEEAPEILLLEYSRAVGAPIRLIQSDQGLVNKNLAVSR